MTSERNNVCRNLFSSMTIVVLLLIGCAPTALVSQKKCIPSSQVYEKGTGIAVWDFEITSPSGNVRPDRFLSDKIIIRILKEEHYDLITRDQILLVLEQLNLGTSLLVDEHTRLRISELVGAKLMVFGEVVEIIGNRMLIHLRLVEVETAKIRTAVEKYYDPAPSDLPAWLKATEEMTSELFEICQ